MRNLGCLLWDEKMMQLNRWMKKFLKPCMLAFAVAPMGSVIVSWDANTEADLKGYRVYFGNASRSYSFTYDVGSKTELRLDTLRENTPYYFSVTAYDTAGNESGYSEEVYFIMNSQESDSSEPIVQPKARGRSYNFPNPFKAGQQVTQVRYVLEEPGAVRIEVFDMSNRLVRTVLDNVDKAAGEHIEDGWDGKDEVGNIVGNGVYLCRIQTAAFTDYVKIVVSN